MKRLALLLIALVLWLLTAGCVYYPYAGLLLSGS